MNSTRGASDWVAVGEAKSKIILAGEHAVVYGIPAIAIPFPLNVRVRVRQYEHQGIYLQSSLYKGMIEAVPSWLWGIRDMLHLTVERLEIKKPQLYIQLDSQIPIGRGLGSSAAIAIALVRGLYAYLGEVLEDSSLYQLVGMAESYAHGNASGIDMVTQSSFFPILFQKNQPPKAFVMKQPLYICVADTGQRGETKEAVNKVALSYQKDPMTIGRYIEDIATCVRESRKAIEKGDIQALGKQLSRNHTLLTELEVSHKCLDHLVQEAMNDGALGAKMTGGGLGGCMIALCKDEASCLQVGRHLLGQGADRAWYFVTNQEEAIEIQREGMDVQWA